jgi:hypothetical protein
MVMPWLPELALSLAVPGAALAGSAAVGRVAPGGLGEDDVELRLSLGLAAALVFAQALGMSLCFLGVLRAPLVLGGLVAGAALGLWAGRGSLGRLPADALGGAPWAALMVPWLLVATFPPWERDELVYHLALPRAFAAAGGYVRPDDNIFASLPSGWESIEALLHALGSAPLYDAPFNPRLLGAWTAWGVCLATVALARELGAGRLAWLAGAALSLVPTFAEFASLAYVEPYLVLVSTLGLVAALRVSRGQRGWWWVAGVLGGVAASVKYSGLAVAGLLAAVVAVGSVAAGSTGDPAAPGAPAGGGRAGEGGTRAEAGLRVLAVAALVGAPFYVRNLLQRGNPFFPMAFGLLGGEGWDDLRAAAYWETLRQYGAGEGVLGALSAPLRLFFARDHLAGFEGSIGPLPLLGGVAGAAIVARSASPERAHAARLVLGFAGLFTLFWASTVVQARFYLVAVPALLALGAAALAELRAPRAVAIAASAASLALSLAWGASSYAWLWTRQPTTAWLRGALTRDQALERVLPDSYAAMQAVDALVPQGARVWLVWMRGYTYYLRRPYRLDSVYEEWRLAELLDRATEPGDVPSWLRRDGVGYLLINERFFLQQGSADTSPGRTARLRGRFERLVQAGALRVVWRRNAVVLYAIP